MRRPTRRDEMTDGEADFLGLPERLTPEEEEAQEKEDAERLEDRRLFLYRLLNDPDFRAWLWDKMVAFGTFENRFMASPTGFPDQMATQFQAGMKAAGWALWEEFDNAAPDLASLMRREGSGQIAPQPSGRAVVTDK